MNAFETQWVVIEYYAKDVTGFGQEIPDYVPGEARAVSIIKATSSETAIQLAVSKPGFYSAIPIESVEVNEYRLVPVKKSA